jgi:UDP-GlcNAc:undecaprenyl-phosphate GlcNAc-1-phosphate transferase
MSQAPGTQLSPVNVLWCVALPVFDTFAVMYRRMRQGRSPFKPDRGHIHHILLGFGLTPRATLAILILLAAGLALIGAFFSSAAHSAGTNLTTFCLTLGVYVITVTHVWLRQEARRSVAAGSEAVDPPSMVDAGVIASEAAVREVGLPVRKDELMFRGDDQAGMYRSLRRSTRR